LHSLLDSCAEGQATRPWSSRGRFTLAKATVRADHTSVKDLLAKALAWKKTGIIFAGGGVTTQYRSTFVENNHLPFKNLQGIVQTLESLKFDFLSMDQVIELSKKKFRYHKHWVHLSFDDGYQNNFDLLYPYLSGKQIPFSVFVSTHNIESQERFPGFLVRLAFYQKRDLARAMELKRGQAKNIRDFTMRMNYASPAEHERYVKNLLHLIPAEELPEYYNDKPCSLFNLTQMARDPLVHIGSHSHKHLYFHAKQETPFMQYNLNHSRQLLRDAWKLTQNPTFSFPGGVYTHRAAGLAQHAGYPLSFTKRSGVVNSSTHPQLVPRFVMSDPQHVLRTCALAVAYFW
jgi:peptidoglycan/xylan/chitin deacetylase (PgdA/CDA1 family)